MWASMMDALFPSLKLLLSQGPPQGGWKSEKVLHVGVLNLARMREPKP
jgi:hypothetical protein